MSLLCGRVRSMALFLALFLLVLATADGLCLPAGAAHSRKAMNCM